MEVVVLIFAVIGVWTVLGWLAKRINGDDKDRKPGRGIGPV